MLRVIALLLISASVWGHEVRPLPQLAPHSAGFVSVNPDQSGVFFTNLLALDRQLTNQILLNGSGVAAGDVDGDGQVDLYFCGLDAHNALYRNLGGWKFEDVTAAAGLACTNLDATAAALVDFDGDGDLDLIVNSVGGGTHLFLNMDGLRFRQATPPRGLNPGKGGMSLAIGDLDLDGFLDVYICNYRTSALMDMPGTDFKFRTVDGQRVISHVNGRPANAPDLLGRFRISEKGNIEENGDPDVLYRNVGGTNVYSYQFSEGRFQDATGKPMAQPLLDWGLSAMFRDINRDGLPDLYVCNDFDAPDQMWINQGQGRFRLIEQTAFRKSSHFSMGVDFGDINRDGLDDLLVLDMLSREHLQRMDMLPERSMQVTAVGEWRDRPSYMMNTLFLNQGDASFAEIAQLSGLDASEWSWTVIFLDVDLDGFEDVLVSNGHARAGRSMDIAAQLKAMRSEKTMSPAEILAARKIYPSQASVNAAFRNRGDLTFAEVSQAWGFIESTVSHGMALADLDNDGDLDLVVNNLNAAASLFRNESSASRVAVHLRGRPPNTRGIGARITVEGGPIQQSQEMICGGRYLSSDEAVRVFAGGDPTNRLRIQVDWPRGGRTILTNVPANAHCIVEEDTNVTSVGPAEPDSPAGWWRGAGPETSFEEVDRLPNQLHVEKLFDDFGRQPLLPRRLSQLGPGVAWFDYDADGWEDLFLGAGTGGNLLALRNNGQGGFELMDKLAQSTKADLTSVLGIRWAEQPSALVAGIAAYELAAPLRPVTVVGLGVEKLVEIIPVMAGSVGPLALADVDGDGDLDLFIGCRVDSYPEALGSWLCRFDQTGWAIDSEETAVFARAGMVSGAVWSDLDNDGDPDLVLACEWGPVRVFVNQSGRFSEQTQSWQLDKYLGWWNGVVTGDFDEDGRMDIVASNWGRNTPYQAHRERPLRLYYGDVDGNGAVEWVEAYFDPALQKMVPERQRDALAMGLPTLAERFPLHREFAKASVEDILGKSVEYLEANWLESTLFLNRGDHFEARPLPVEAQMAPAFGIVVADFDGDGHEDLVLSQNFFATTPGTPRYDGGRGLWLRGNGQGRFSAVPGRLSGLKVLGEQRGCATADYDHDGRADLVIAQNGSAPRLYRNRTGTAGTRVRLQGGANNPEAIGARVAVGDSSRLGPAREVQAGAGYWSQNSSTVIPAFSGKPTRVWVRWPGGEVTEVPTEGKAEVLVKKP